MFSLALAARAHLEVPAYSLFALASALATSLVWLCLTIPLGVRMSAMATGTLAVLILITISVIVIIANASDPEALEALRVRSQRDSAR